MLIDAARALYPFDRIEARATLMMAFAAWRPNGRLALPGEGVIAVCAAARSMPPDASAPLGFADLLLDGVAALLTAAPERFDDADDGGPEGLVWMAIGCWAAGVLGDDETLHAMSERFVEVARAGGSEIGLAHGLLCALAAARRSARVDRLTADGTREIHHS
jgi:hypothetical protein